MEKKSEKTSKKREKLTDEEVEAEIERLKNDPYVKLARKETNKKRARLYQLRWLKKKGKDLADSANSDNEEVEKR